MLERTFVAVLSKPIAVEPFLGLVADLLPPSR
jgi:hypothetical protein